MLHENYKQIKHLEKVIIKCYTDLYTGKNIPLSNIGKITLVIEEFLDSIHYSREEDSYFPCVASYDHLKQEIRSLLIEHNFLKELHYKSKNISKDGKKEKMQENMLPDF